MVNPFLQGFVKKSISHGLTEKQALDAVSSLFPSSAGRAGLPDTAAFAAAHAGATLTPRNTGAPNKAFPMPANPIGAASGAPLKGMNMGTSASGTSKANPSLPMAGAAKLTG